MNEFFGKTEKLCQQEQIDSLAVEALMMQAIGLEHGKPSQRDSVLEVAQSKLVSATETLKVWLRYAYLLDKGYPEEAAKLLKNFDANRWDFPLISSDRQQKLVLGAEGAAKPEIVQREEISRILATIESADRGQILAAIDQIEGIPKNKESESMRTEALRKLNSLARSLEILGSGDPSSAFYYASENILLRSQRGSKELERGEQFDLDEGSARFFSPNSIRHRPTTVKLR